MDARAEWFGSLVGDIHLGRGTDSAFTMSIVLWLDTHLAVFPLGPSTSGCLLQGA